MPDVEIETRENALWIRLNRPERRNAFDTAMANTIVEAFDRAADARAVVLTGNGGSFCAGGSLASLAMPTTGQMRALYHGSIRLFDAIRNCPRPVIAAVHGPAAGGGNELIMACDLAVATRSSTFGQTGPRVGSAPVTGGTNVLAVQLGEKRAKEMAFLCRRYTAAQALEWGMVNEVVEDDQLESTVDGWCAEIAKLSPRYLEITKISSNIWWNSARDSFLQGIGMLTQAVGSPDMLEGANAFLEKRKPSFPAPE